MHPTLEAALAELERARRELEETLRAEMAPSSVSRDVLLEHELAALATPLGDRNIVATVAPAWLGDDERQRALSSRIVIVADERPYISDASYCRYRIVSLRFLASRDPAQCSLVIADALSHRALWALRHGWLVLLRDDALND